ncbi:hypothetical protein DRO48_04115 [Candidatus Bathyarchaeota archaeon]|nr:MAG: hypothetical protein DRO48_04115 [Candidatus Bathyarchaeota archaeon]
MFPLLLPSLALPAFGALVLAIPFLLGINIGRKACGAISTLFLLISTLLLAYAGIYVLKTGTPIREYYHIPIMTFRGELDLFADGLSLPIALLISLLSTLSSLYSIQYMDKIEIVHFREIKRNVYYSVAYKEALFWPEYVPRRKSPTEVPSIEAYYINLLLFAMSMLGIVLSTNLIHFLIFYEFVTVPTALLVYIWGSGPCRLIAIKYFIYMLVGGALVMVAIAWIYAVTGCIDILCLYPSLEKIHGMTLISISVLLLVGFGMKAALFPLHTWLSDFHSEAPAPVSALLSGVLIKCGAYGVLRIACPCIIPVITQLDVPLLYLALITAVWGAFMAVMQRQIKRILAYSSINQIGYIIMGIASGNPTGMLGAMLHIINHGVGKALLFLSAGAITHATGSRNVDELGGLGGRMPVTASTMLIGGLSLAGVPPLAGFMSEWLIFLGIIRSGHIYIAVLGLITTIFTMGYYLWAIRRIFFQKPKKDLKNVSEAPAIMLVALIIESLLVIALGVYPQPAVKLFSIYLNEIKQITGGL